MTDPIDRACETEELFRKNSLQAQAEKAQQSRKEFTGICDNCEAEISVGFYCDAACRDDYANRLRCEKLR